MSYYIKPINHLKEKAETSLEKVACVLASCCSTREQFYPVQIPTVKANLEAAELSIHVDFANRRGGKRAYSSAGTLSIPCGRQELVEDA